jgi:hypothetical protein
MLKDQYIINIIIFSINNIVLKCSHLFADNATYYGSM